MLNRSRCHQREAAEEKEKGSQSELLSQIEELKKEASLLQKDLDEAQIIKLEADKNAELLHRLYQNDITDENGELKE